MPKGKLVNVQVSSLRHAEFTQFITRFLDDVEKEALDFKNEDVITAYMMFYFLRTFSSGPISGDTVWYWILLIADILVICTFLIKREKEEKSEE